MKASLSLLYFWLKKISSNQVLPPFQCLHNNSEASEKREGCLTSEGTTTLVTNQQWLQEVANPLPPNVVDSQSLAISKKGTCLMACQSALSGKRGSSYVIDHSEQTWTCQRCYSRLLCPDHSVGVFFQKLQSDKVISQQASGN